MSYIVVVNNSLKKGHEFSLWCCSKLLSKQMISQVSQHHFACNYRNIYPTPGATGGCHSWKGIVMQFFHGSRRQRHHSCCVIPMKQALPRLVYFGCTTHQCWVGSSFSREPLVLMLIFFEKN